MSLENTSKNNGAAAGQYGAVFTDSTTSPLIAANGKYFFSITFLEATTFDSSFGLVSLDDDKFLNTQQAASASGSGGAQVDVNNTFPAGLTIFGQWSKLNLTTGSVICHVVDK